MQIHSVPAGVCLALFATGAFAIASAQTLSNADKAFMTAAAKANMTEAHEGQMAESQGTADDIKELGKTLDQDHTQAYKELQDLATQKSVSIPTGINAEKVATIVQLQRLKGSAFDKAFAKDEVTTHHQAIAEFQREADHGSDADVKAYATKTLPALKKHLSMAESCEKSAK